MFPWPLFLQKAATFDLLSGRYGRTLAWFSLSVLAALGLEALVTDGLSRKAKIAAASVSLLWWGSGRLLHVPGASEAARHHWVPMTGRIAPVLGVLTLVFAVGLLLYLMSMTRRFRPWMAVGLAAMAVTVVVGRHADFNVYWNRSSPELAAPVAQSRSAAGLREWFPHWGLREFLPPNLAGVFGVYDLRYSDPMTPRRYTLVPWPRTSHQDLFESWGGAATARFLGVGRVWSLAGGAGGGKSPALHSRALPGPPGRAFWVWRHQISATPAAAVNAALKHDAWEKTVYLQRDPGGAGDLPAGVDAPVDLTALVVSSERLSWQVKAPKEGWLVIRQLFWPGWEARIDGRSVPLYAGDGLFQCIRVPAGRHHVELRYAPWSFKLGVLAVFISLLWILIWPAVRRGVHRG
ncbi:MAG: YfhO family protein, partial [Acidobacteriota bacterium]